MAPLSLTAYSLLLPSIPLLLSSIYTLYNPASTMRQWSFETAEPARVFGLSALSVATYNILAAYQNNRAYFLLSALGKLVGGCVIASFGPEWMGLVGWEWGTATLTGVCLLLEGGGRAKGITGGMAGSEGFGRGEGIGMRER